MNLSEWFSYQLKASGEGFMWAVEQVPVGRRDIAPPILFGEWPVNRHIFHMLYYERIVVLPHMGYWLNDGPLPSIDDYDEEKAWESAKYEKIEHLLTQFQQVRAEQIALLSRFDEATWHEVHHVLWGDVSMKWIVSKTFQHTAEHTHDVMRIALFWDMHVAYQEKQKQQEVQE